MVTVASSWFFYINLGVVLRTVLVKGFERNCQT